MDDENLENDNLDDEEDDVIFITSYIAKKWMDDAAEEVRYTALGQEYYHVDEYGNPLPST